RWMGAINRLSPQERRGWLAFSNVVFEEQIDVREASGVRFVFIPDAQRWHWYSCAMPAKNAEEAWAEMESEWGSAPQPGRRVILEESSNGGNGECRSGEPARVTMISERPDQVTLRVEAAEPGWLELMDSWYPGWTVTVSGVQVDLMPADYQFKAVFIEKGDHLIAFSYRPPGFYFSGLFSILVVLLGVFLWITKRRVS
ncbi:MAG: YfhO family protein, partial [Anaerolineaceae bacterium]|nr:YfhO family protein [Anaerolineaceae bacterium]